MRLHLSILALVILLLPCSAYGEEVRLACVADAALSSYNGEQELNYGASTRIRLKGIQSLGLFQFDLTPVAGWNVDKATLFLRYAGNDRKLRTIGLSTVSAPWAEGSGAGESKPGEVCFAWREQGKTRWAGPQTDFTDVSFTAGNTMAAYSEAKEVGDGWIAIPVEPRLAQVLIAGLSYGLAVTDEKGQTAANNDVYAREQSSSRPYLVVTGHPGAKAGPRPVMDVMATPSPGLATFATGAAIVTFNTFKGTLGYDATYTAEGGAPAPVERYRIPFAHPGQRERIQITGLPPGKMGVVMIRPVSSTGVRGQSVIVPVRPTAKAKPLALSVPARAHPLGRTRETPGNLRVWAYPDTEKAHPVTGNLLEEVGLAAYAGQPAGQYRTSNAVWDGARIRLHTARNEIVAFHLAVEPAGGSARNVAIELPVRLTTAGGSAIEPQSWIYRDWYVKEGEWFPEACVPLSGPFDIPAADNAVPGQRNQSVLVEMLVPRDAKPGVYAGAISVQAGGIKPILIPVELTVNALTLPDKLSFDISLNTYGTVGHHFGVDDRTAEYRRIEREYHRAAHAHRTTFAPLGYSHSGTTSANYAPPLEGKGAEMRVKDWSAWDEQFSPYLSGTAFQGLPRSGMPITHLYLPFHEAWPADIRTYYHYMPTVQEYPAMIAEHALKAPPIEEAMDPALGREFVGVVRQFAEHFREKGWTKTEFQFYQNDKHYYKDPKVGGRGTSWWLLDEPNHRDDWLALAYFAKLFREGMQGFQDVRMVHREDLSRPQWQRDYLDGLVDLMVVSGELFNKGPLLEEMRQRTGARYWNYGTANDVKTTNVTAEAWAVRAWLAGADGIVPWQTVGSDTNFTKPDETALLLPGKRFGLNGPIVSLRLKALRRAQQDAEYLVLLAKAKGWDREQVAAAVARLLNLEGAFESRDADDAGRFRFAALRAQQFSDMRRAIANAVAK
jgi:hypothetical protein